MAFLHMIRAAGWALVLVTLTGCSPSDTGSTSKATPFSEDQVSTGRVIENIRACEVDAMCFLRIEFADTSIVVLYGTGERPPPHCSIPVEVSNAAFLIRQGDVVDVVISLCGTDSYYLRRIGLATG